MGNRWQLSSLLSSDFLKKEGTGVTPFFPCLMSFSFYWIHLFFLLPPQLWLDKDAGREGWTGRERRSSKMFAVRSVKLRRPRSSAVSSSKMKKGRKECLSLFQSKLFCWLFGETGTGQYEWNKTGWSVHCSFGSRTVRTSDISNLGWLVRLITPEAESIIVER